jgi:uncharacterized protein (DUF952 family)
MLKENNIIVHVCTKEEWQKAEVLNEFRVGSLDSEGFIHCSELDTILRVANSNWRGRKDLIILFIDSAKVISLIKYEPDSESGILYPHVYGPINLDAVVKIKEFLPKEDGSFDSPSIVEK